MCRWCRHEVARLGATLRIRNRIEQPAPFQAGEICRQRQSGFLDETDPDRLLARTPATSARSGRPSQTMALCRGLPERSQISAVSRWLVRPTAARSAGARAALARASTMTSRVFFQISRGSRFDPAGSRKNLAMLFLRAGDDSRPGGRKRSPRAGRSLVDGADISAHLELPPSTIFSFRRTPR